MGRRLTSSVYYILLSHYYKHYVVVNYSLQYITVSHPVLIIQHILFQSKDLNLLLWARVLFIYPAKYGGFFRMPISRVKFYLCRWHIIFFLYCKKAFYAALTETFQGICTKILKKCKLYRSLDQICKHQ